MKAILGKRVVPIEEAAISVQDRGWLYGDSIFETLVATNGVIFRCREHWQRLMRSAQALFIPLTISEAAFSEALRSALEANQVRDGILRFTVTRGLSARGLKTDPGQEPTIVVLCYPPPKLDPDLVKHGASVVVSRWRRIPDSCIPAAAKSGNFLNGILATREAMAAGADEAFLLTIEGNLAEGATSNIFTVRDDRLWTPALSEGVLPGITRGAVIEMAGQCGIACEQTRLPASALEDAQEVFYTSTSVGVMPVRQIGNRALDPHRPVTTRLRERLAAMMAQPEE